MRITHVDSRSVLVFALVLGGCTILLDLVIIVALWLALGFAGVLSGLGVGIGAPAVIAVGSLLGIMHGAVTVVLIWLAGTAFNLSTFWTGGLGIKVSDPTDRVVVLPDTSSFQNGRESIKQVSLNRD